MNDYLYVIVKMLWCIHYENILLFSFLSGEEEGGENIEKMQKNFEKAYEGIMKK